MNEDKLQQIEITLAHQEQQIQDLNDMINRQWQDIDTLKKILKKTQDKLGEIESGTTTNDPTDGLSVSELAAQEKPPHY